MNKEDLKKHQLDCINRYRVVCGGRFRNDIYDCMVSATVPIRTESGMLSETFHDGRPCFHVVAPRDDDPKTVSTVCAMAFESEALALAWIESCRALVEA